MEESKIMLSEYDIRMEIDEALKNKKWVLTGPNKNVHAEKSLERKRPDYVLMDKNNNKPLIIIEAKRPGKDLISALNQAKKYALKIGAPIAYATDGSIIKTLHIDTNKPLFLNGDEVEEFITEQIAFKYLNTNEVYTISQKIIKSRQELINVFSLANKELRKEGLQAGIERFSEFCTILFLKLYSEQEIIRENNNDKLRIDPEYRWDFFKTFSGTELIAYVNNVVIKEHFQKIYGEDIFQPLKIKNPKVLKNIINNLDELSLSDINSDIKGDAFEYFLKAYLANQHKDLGEYFTPRHIVKTLVKLINPKFGEAIYDPFCGTGGMLIESFKHIFNRMPRNEETLDFLKKNTIYGREITTNARITKMNMILTGDGHNNIQRIDSLANPIDNKYDIVITNMPFSLGNFDEYSGLYSLGSANGNFLCIEHCLRSIKPGGRMAIIIPDGILFDKKYKK
ncbi:N-6 DNA methylase [Spiroplasma citri]|nr:N-6 DNA methylase [Spiroplasma citri]